MKPATLSIAAGLLLVVPAIAGCAGEEAEAGDAAYPPIGYTPPAQAARPPPPPSQPAAPPGDAQQVASSGGAQPAAAAAGPAPWQWAPPSDEGASGPAGSEAGNDTGDEGGYADTDPSALSDFRAPLDPYGTWTDDPNYGTVWVPSPSVVGPDFTPYVSAGHWAYDTDYVWVSDYDWGWAPFHYGRWVYGPGFGWEWVPGRVYAGAWVSWRYGVDDWAYVGWAPLAPTWCWRGGVAVGIGYVPRAPYAFVGTGELFAPQVGGRIIAGPQVGVVASHTQPFVPSGSRVAARPGVGGPSPTDLHIAPGAVARAPADNRGLMQARAFSRPATAVGLGARAPASVAARSAPVAYSRAGGSVPSYQLRGTPSSSSHFGGRLGGGFAGSAAASGPMRSYPSYSSARPYFGSAPATAMRSASPAVRPYSSPMAARPPTPGSAFRASAPTPSFRSSAPSAGAFRASPGVSSFHSAGSSGGFHGGGGAHASGHR
jgi:hypothetical protein